MSHIKGNIDQSSKGKLYQTKTVSDKNIPTTKNDLTHVLHLNDYIKQSKVEDLFNYIQKEKPSQFEIKIAINELLKKYEPKNEIFYNMLDIFLKTGWPINFGINFPQIESQKIFNFELNENEEITLLNLAILLNDIEFVKLVLKYHDQQSINQLDKKGYNAIVYSVLYNKNDNTDIIKLLIANGANVNQNFKIEISPNKYEDHSIFTIACYKNLPNIIKVLVDNPQTYVNFTINPSGDTGLHICARGGMENALKELLSCDRINPEILNKDSKKALELISDNEEKNEMMKLFVNFYNNKSMKKNDVNNTTNNLSMMNNNNNQYSNMNTTMNKKIVGNDQINLNNINNINSGKILSTINEEAPENKINLNINTNNTNINNTTNTNNNLTNLTNTNKKKAYSKMYCSNEIVIQKYLDNPLLYYKRKFDIRCFVLVDSNLNVFFCKEGHLKASSEFYDLSCTNKLIHITNYSLQKKSSKFEQYEDGNEISYNDFKPWILEINNNPGLCISSPVIQKLVPRMLDDAFRLTIDKIFETKYDYTCIEDDCKYKSKYKIDGFNDEENVFEFLCNIK